jgi:hypothetical protein
MAITKLPPGFKLAEPLICAICNVKLTLDKATTGMVDSDRRQTFACVSHFSEVEKLIMGWADFTSKERYRSLHHDYEPRDLLDKAGGHHVRLDS